MFTTPSLIQKCHYLHFKSNQIHKKFFSTFSPKNYILYYLFTSDNFKNYSVYSFLGITPDRFYRFP